MQTCSIKTFYFFDLFSLRPLFNSYIEIVLFVWSGIISVNVTSPITGGGGDNCTLLKTIENLSWSCYYNYRSKKRKRKNKRVWGKIPAHSREGEGRRGEREGKIIEQRRNKPDLIQFRDAPYVLNGRDNGRGEQTIEHVNCNNVRPPAKKRREERAAIATAALCISNYLQIRKKIYPFTLKLSAIYTHTQFRSISPCLNRLVGELRYRTAIRRCETN